MTESAKKILFRNGNLNIANTYINFLINVIVVEEQVCAFTRNITFLLVRNFRVCTFGTLYYDTISSSFPIC